MAQTLSTKSMVQDQQHVYHLGVYHTCRTLGSTTHLLNQNLLYNKIPR